MRRSIPSSLPSTRSWTWSLCEKTRRIFMQALSTCKLIRYFCKAQLASFTIFFARWRPLALLFALNLFLFMQVVQCLKLISRPGCEKICNYAFEYARRNKRKKVSCFVKDSIQLLDVILLLFGSVPEFSPPKLEVWFLNFFSVWLSGCILDIMKMTDGLFYKVFEEVAQRYPDIQRDK